MPEILQRIGSWGRRIAVIALAGAAGIASQRLDIFPSTYLPARWTTIAVLLSILIVVLAVRIRRSSRRGRRAGIVAGLLVSLWFWGTVVLAMTGWDVYLASAPAPGVVDWGRRAAHPIEHLARYDPRDYEFLRPLLEGRRVVLLGESSHRVEEYNQAKANLIRYLHEELGFNVLAFESYMLSCRLANRDLSDRTTLARAIDCLYPMWHTEAVRRLFRYIAWTRTTDTPMMVAGFDQKVRRGHWGDTLELFSTVCEADSALYERFRAAQTTFGPDIHRRLLHKEIDKELGEEFAAFYRGLADDLERRAGRSAVYNDDLLFAAQLARSISTLPRRYRTRSPWSRVALRDSVMAENAVHLIERQFPGEKIIIWGHNSHISRSWSTARLSDLHTQSFAWITNRLDQIPRVGEYLGERYGDAMYSVGLYMASGSYETIRGEKRRARPLRRDSVEYLLHDPEAEAVFVDLSNTGDSTGLEWQHSPSKVQTDSFWYSIRPAEQYDGVLVVSRANPPEEGE